MRSRVSRAREQVQLRQADSSDLCLQRVHVGATLVSTSQLWGKASNAGRGENCLCYKGPFVEGSWCTAQWYLPLFLFRSHNGHMLYPDAGKDGGQEEKGAKEDEMVGWYH